MSGVSSTGKCPICGGVTDAYLETKTNEREINCLDGCGYAAFAGIQEPMPKDGRLFWVETERLPMTEDGVVSRPKGKRKQANPEQLSLPFPEEKA
jgi:hypothetical protein